MAERAPAGFTRIDQVVGRDELAAVTGSYRQVAGFDIDDLNIRPSWNVGEGVARRAAGERLGSLSG